MAKTGNVTLTQPFAKLKAIPSIFWGAPVLTGADGRPYCPGYIGATYSNFQHDYVQIEFPGSGVFDRTPGICNVSVRRGRGIDRKKSAGSDGERLTFKGINNADIEISITIWTPDQLARLQDLWRILQPPLGKGDPQAFDVKHPQLQFLGVKSAVFVDCSGLEQGSTNKTRVFTIKAVEYFPPGKKNVTASPKKALSRGSKLDPQKPGENPENLGPKPA